MGSSPILATHAPVAELVDAQDLGSCSRKGVQVRFLSGVLKECDMKLKCWVTRRYNGLYLITAFEPVIQEVHGTGHDDAYIKYGDPVGYINVPYAFGMHVFDDPPQERVVPQRGTLFGGLSLDYTHQVESKGDNLYSISNYYNEYSRIDNVCAWFILKMFSIERMLEGHSVRVHFSGEMK